MDVALNQGNECYICLEKTIYFSPCNCKERALCENCYVKLLLYDYKRCTICRGDFPEMQEEKIQPPEQTEVPTCTYTPMCCRHRSERIPRTPSKLWADLIFHVVMLFVLTSFSCYLTMTCSGRGLLYNLVPVVVFYVVVTFMTVILC